MVTRKRSIWGAPRALSLTADVFRRQVADQQWGALSEEQREGIGRAEHDRRFTALPLLDECGGAAANGAMDGAMRWSSSARIKD